jgi:hypothetical protein
VQRGASDRKLDCIGSWKLTVGWLPGGGQSWHARAGVAPPENQIPTPDKTMGRPKVLVEEMSGRQYCVLVLAVPAPTSPTFETVDHPLWRKLG